MNKFENGNNFINLRELQSRTALGETVEKPFFGRSPISIGTVEQSKASRRVAETLLACKRAGIFRPDAQIGINSVVHELTGLAFVEFQASETTPVYNMHARLIVPDRNRFLQNGNSLLENTDRLTLISGPCLFSAPGVKAVSEGGQEFNLGDPGVLDSAQEKITGIKVDKRLQAYEVDAIQRLTQVMSAVNTDDKQVELALNIPRIEYWCYILDAFERGRLDSQVALKWFSEVDQRAQGIERLIKKRVPQEFNVRRINPLRNIEETILEAVRSGGKNTLPKVLNQLASESLVLRHAVQITNPRRFLDIAYMSYAVAHLAATQTDSTLPIVIESPEETKILKESEKLFDGLDVRLLALFPHSNALPNFEPEDGRKNMYFFPPQDSQLAVLRDITKINKSTT